MSLKIQIQGLEPLRKKLEKLAPAAADALHAQVLAEAGSVMNEAQQRVPVVTGRLRSSAFVREVQRNQYRTDVAYGYEAPYAIFVHEIPYDGHTTRGLPGAVRNGLGYKWLQLAANKVLRGAPTRLASAVRQALRVLGR